MDIATEINLTDIRQRVYEGFVLNKIYNIYDVMNDSLCIAKYLRTDNMLTNNYNIFRILMIIRGPILEYGETFPIIEKDVGDEYMVQTNLNSYEVYKYVTAQDRANTRHMYEAAKQSMPKRASEDLVPHVMEYLDRDVRTRRRGGKKTRKGKKSRSWFS